MTTPNNNKKQLFALCLAAPLLLLPSAANADNFEISCRELNAGPDKTLPAPYKAVWDGSILTQIAADSNGKISQSSERVVANRRLPMPNGKGLKYSFVTGVHKTTQSRFLTNISVEPGNNPLAADNFTASVSYATVDRDGFLIYAFEVVNENCTLNIGAAETAGNPPAAETPAEAPAIVAPAAAPAPPLEETP